MKNIFILQICFKYHIFSPFFNICLDFLTRLLYYLYFNCLHFFPEFLNVWPRTKNRIDISLYNETKKSQVINCTKFSHFLLYSDKQDGPTKMHNTYTPWEKSFQPSFAEKVKNQLLFQQQPFLPHTNQFLFQLALIKSMLVSLLSLD